MLGRRRTRQTEPRTGKTMSKKKMPTKKPKSAADSKGKVAIKRGTKPASQDASEVALRAPPRRAKKGKAAILLSPKVHEERPSAKTLPLPDPGIALTQDEDKKTYQGDVSHEVAGSQSMRLGAGDPRLPQVPTTLVRRDRHGVAQCECTVGPDGIFYNGRQYRSLSGAASAASKDLGLNPVVNGFVFFNLSKPARTRMGEVERLQRIGKRYEEYLGALLAARQLPDEAVKKESTEHAERVVRILEVCAG